MNSKDRATELLCLLSKFKKLHHHSNVHYGMNKADFFMLSSIEKASCEEGEGVTISSLSKLNHISMPAISQAVSILEKNGLVERKAGKKDRRVVCVFITNKGKSILKDAYEHMMKYAQLITEKLGEEDAKTLARLVDRLYDITTEIESERKEP